MLSVVDDGVLPDDQRRSGGFVWPPTKENYVWEALQGAIAQAVILHRAGFLDGRKATTHWGALHELRALGGGCEVQENVRWVEDGNVITSAGVSAGIDMSLYLVSKLKDDNTAKAVQKMMEYYPKPPEFAEVAI